MIEAFSEDRPRLTATEAGERALLTRTAARRYLLSLVHYGYAATDGKYYWLLPRVLLNTSVYHNVHHANAEANFAEALTVWDRICRTRLEDRAAAKAR